MSNPLFDKRYTKKYICSFIVCALSIALLIAAYSLSVKKVIDNPKDSTVIYSTALFGPDYKTQKATLAKGTAVKVLAVGEGSDDDMLLVETSSGLRGWASSYNVGSREGVVVDDFMLYTDSQRNNRYRFTNVGERVKLISVGADDMYKIRVNDSIFFMDKTFGDLMFETEALMKVMDNEEKAQFSSKSFDKKVLGRSLAELEERYGVAFYIAPVRGTAADGDFKAIFPFRICNYREKTASSFVEVSFEGGKAVSHSEEMEGETKYVKKWVRNRYNPLARGFIEAGILTSAWQYSGVRPDMDGKEASLDLNQYLAGSAWWQEVLRIVLMLVCVVALYILGGYIPYYVVAPLFGILRYSAKFTETTAKWVSLVCGSISYILFFTAICVHWGFMWVVLVILFLAWRRVYYYTLLFIPGKDYLSFLSLKCVECNHYDSYEIIARDYKGEYNSTTTQGKDVYTHTTKNEWTRDNVHYIQPVDHYRHEVWRRKYNVKVYDVTKKCTECGAIIKYEEKCTTLTGSQQVG